MTPEVEIENYNNRNADFQRSEGEEVVYEHKVVRDLRCTCSTWSGSVVQFIELGWMNSTILNLLHRPESLKDHVV